MFYLTVRTACMTGAALAVLWMADCAYADSLPSAVPELRTLDLASAEVLAAEAGVELVVLRLEAPYRPGQVIDQIPGAGAVLGADRRVRIEVSDGRTIPNVLGLPHAEAEAELERLGIASETTQRPVEQVAAGLVGALIPSVGTRIDPTQHVVFVVVSELELVVIPADIIGLRHSQAETRLRDLGLTVTFDQPIRDNIDGGLCGPSVTYFYTVTGISASPGTSLPRGEGVQLSLHMDQDRRRGGPCTPEGVPY